MRNRFALAFGLLAALSLSACVGIDDVKSARDDAVSLRDRLAFEEAMLRTQADPLPLDSPERSALESQAASSRTAQDALTQAISDVDRALTANESPSASSTAGAIAAWVPDPWKAPVILGGAAVALFLRARQLKKGLQSVAKSIEIAKRDDLQFRNLFVSHANTFRSIQTPAAQRIVDGVTGQPSTIQSPI